MLRYLADVLKTGLDYDGSRDQNQKVHINVFICFTCYPHHHMYVLKPIYDLILKLEKIQVIAGIWILQSL